MRRLAVVVELQRHADDVIALLGQNAGDDGGINAARHRHHDSAVLRASGQVEAVHLLDLLCL